MKTDVLKKVATILFILFVFSGLFKWIKIWPIDPTVLFGALTIGSLILLLLLQRSHTLYKTEIRYLAFFGFFSLWFYASMLYSTSPSYMYTKATNFVLIIISFIIPYVTIQSEKDIKFYLYSFSSVGLIISAVLFYLYIVGGNNLYYTYFKLLEYGNPLEVPDYLVLASPIGLSMLISIFFKNNYFKLLGLFSGLTLILLSGRGPVIALIVTSLLLIIIQFKFNKKMLRNVILALIIIPFLSSYLYNWKGMERLNDRMEGIGNDDKSLEIRYKLLYSSKDLFLKNPILGIGLGSFGIVVTGIDQRVSPHNFLLEIIVEQGLIGFILFMLFFIPFIIFVCRKLLFADEPIFYTLVGLFIYELINALKSSSITEHRLFFALIGICIVSYKFLKPLKKSQFL